MIKSDLCWPRVSGKPFLFGDVCDSDCLFVVILMAFELQLVAGSIIVTHLHIEFASPFLRMVYGPMRSMHILSQEIAYASFSGRSPNFLEVMRLFS
jgi:hypothetical protein